MIFSAAEKSLGECQWRQFSKHFEDFRVVLKHPKASWTSLDSDTDGWLNEKVEIDFSNNETFECINREGLIIMYKENTEKSKGLANLRCWRKWDATEDGKGFNKNYNT